MDYLTILLSECFRELDTDDYEDTLHGLLKVDRHTAFLIILKDKGGEYSQFYCEFHQEKRFSENWGYSIDWLGERYFLESSEMHDFIERNVYAQGWVEVSHNYYCP